MTAKKYGRVSRKYKPHWVKAEMDRYGISQAQLLRRMRQKHIRGGPSRICAVLNGRQQGRRIIREAVLMIGEHLYRTSTFCTVDEEIRRLEEISRQEKEDGGT